MSFEERQALKRPAITPQPDGQWSIDCNICGWHARSSVESGAERLAYEHGCPYHLLVQALAVAHARIDELSLLAIPEEDVEELQGWLQDTSRWMPDEAKRLHDRLRAHLGEEPYGYNYDD